MKLLKWFVFLISIGNLLSCLALFLSEKWLLGINQLIVAYVLAEIIHTLYKKQRPPVPTSLAFQKEIGERYKV